MNRDEEKRYPDGSQEQKTMLIYVGVRAAKYSSLLDEHGTCKGVVPRRPAQSAYLIWTMRLENFARLLTSPAPPLVTGGSRQPEGGPRKQECNRAPVKPHANVCFWSPRFVVQCAPV